MESWPVDLRPTVATDRKTGDKRWSEANKPIEGRNAVDVGSRGGAALARDHDGRFGWQFAAADGAGAHRWSIDPDSIVKVFPDTAPPSSAGARSSINTSTNDALRFMRAHYPEIMGFPSALLENEISADRKALRQDPFDVYRGNRLSACRATGETGAYGYLVWSMGYNMQSLNVAPILDDGPEYIIAPQAVPVVTLETPIQQVSFKDMPGDAEGRHLLGVRTISGSHVFEVNGRFDRGSPRIESLGELSSTHTNGRRQVDLAIANSSELNVIVVDDEGTVHRWSTEQLDAISSADDNKLQDRFYKIAMRSSPDEIVLASSKQLQMVDFRVPQFTSLYQIPSDQRDMITSIDISGEPETICLTTTNHLLWLDSRSPDKPLLTWKHRRAWDRSLSSCTIGAAADRTTFLWSRTSSLVTAYDLHQSRSLIRTTSGPYSLLSGHNHSAGAGFAVLPGEGSQVPLCFSMGEGGAVSATLLHSAIPVSPERDSSSVSVSWSKEVQKLDDGAAKLSDDLGPFAERRSVTVELREMYEAAFCQPASYAVPVASAQEAAELLQKMPSVAQEHEHPYEHMLTTFDLAFLSQEEHPQRRRSNFLTGSALSRVQAPAKGLLGVVEKMDFPRGASWSTSHASFSERISKAPSDLSETDIADAYRLRDPHTSHLPSALSSREQEEISTLTLDLGLAQGVYSNEPFRSQPAQNKATFDDLASAAGALSLKDPEPPAMSFGYLRPREQEPVDELAPASPSTQVGLPERGPINASLGARLLLSEWELGTDPEDYEYVDPYGLVEPSQRVSRTRREKPTETFGRPAVMQVQPTQPPILSTQPPTILSSQVPPRLAFPSSPILPAFSRFPQSQLLNTAMPSSQEMWPSTQQVRGPFGERPEARVAKRKAKKRMAGF